MLQHIIALNRCFLMDLYGVSAKVSSKKGKNKDFEQRVPIVPSFHSLLRRAHRHVHFCIHIGQSSAVKRGEHLNGNVEWQGNNKTKGPAREDWEWIERALMMSPWKCQVKRTEVFCDLFGLLIGDLSVLDKISASSNKFRHTIRGRPELLHAPPLIAGNKGMQQLTLYR